MTMKDTNDLIPPKRVLRYWNALPPLHTSAMIVLASEYDQLQGELQSARRALAETLQYLPSRDVAPGFRERIDRGLGLIP